jgi:hypothetical protein
VTSSLVSRPEIFCCVLVGRRSRSLMLFVGQIRVSKQKRRTSFSRSRQNSSSSRPGLLRGGVARAGHPRHLRQADPDGAAEFGGQRVAERLGDLGHACGAGGVPGADQAAQGALRLDRPMLVGIDLFGVGEVTQQRRVTGLMPRQVRPAAMEVVAVAVVHRHPSERRQDAGLGERVQVPATEVVGGGVLGRGRQHVLLGSGRTAPHRNVVSSKPTTTSASAFAHRASMPCTNPSEGPVPPHKSAISWTQRATGTCW